MATPPPLALSLLGLEPAGASPPQPPRAQIQWAADLGFREVALDAARDGLRPRQLDRSARRDLLALLRRLDLRFAGLDLPIPPGHFADPAHQDRAITATSQALALAADLAARPAEAVVTLELPEKATPETLEALAAAAAGCGARLADRRWPPAASAPRSEHFGVAFDPAAAILGGEDPAIAVGRIADWLFSARLSDLGAAGRLAPGQGRLDLAAYAASLATIGEPPIVLDLANVRDQAGAATATLERWSHLHPGG